MMTRMFITQRRWAPPSSKEMLPELVSCYGLTLPKLYWLTVGICWSSDTYKSYWRGGKDNESKIYIQVRNISWSSIKASLVKELIGVIYDEDEARPEADKEKWFSHENTSLTIKWTVDQRNNIAQLYTYDVGMYDWGNSYYCNALLTIVRRRKATERSWPSTRNMDAMWVNISTHCIQSWFDWCALNI